MVDLLAFHAGQRVIHVDMGEVVVTDIDRDQITVTVADEFHDTMRVPADEIC